MPGRLTGATAAPGAITYSVRNSSHSGLSLQRLPVAASAPSENVSSLLDGSGHLFTPGAKAQAVLATGLTPTHLDWHALADGGRDDIFDLLALAEEYQLAA
jgi:hypothetical protein